MIEYYERCPHCEKEIVFDLSDLGYTAKSGVCPYCKESFLVVYYEECLEDYSDCWAEAYTCKSVDRSYKEIKIKEKQ